jgi:hypothetical protein
MEALQAVQQARIIGVSCRGMRPMLPDGSGKLHARELRYSGILHS